MNYYDEHYQGRPVRIVTLRLPLETGKTDGMVMVQVAENRAARNEFARQILFRMMLPQALLIVVAGLMLWYAVGRGLAPLEHATPGNRKPLAPRSLRAARGADAAGSAPADHER